MIELRANILVRRSLTAKYEGRKLLDIFGKYFPRHVPQRFGDSEPLKWQFDPQDLESALQAWGHYGFLLKRTHPDMLMDIRFARPSSIPMHSSIGLLRFQTDLKEDLRSINGFISEVSEVFVADYAAAHILTRNELSEQLEIIGKRPGRDPGILRRRVEREGFSKVLWGLTLPVHTTLWLKRFLPELLWLTVFGQPYVELFGRNRILAVPAYEVQTLPSGQIVVQLTEDLPDSPDGWQNFRAVRDRCKQHLNSNAFFDPGAPISHIYRVPVFHFPKDMDKVINIPQAADVDLS